HTASRHSGRAQREPESSTVVAKTLDSGVRRNEVGIIRSISGTVNVPDERFILTDFDHHVSHTPGIQDSMQWVKVKLTSYNRAVCSYRLDSGLIIPTHS